MRARAAGISSVGICSDAYNANLWQNRHNPTMKHSLTVVTLLTLSAVALLAVQRRGASFQLAGPVVASDEGISALA
jgi:hypothetical protein